MPTLDFWFSIGSTYTYLSVMRIGALAKTEGVDVRWRPFSVRAIMQEANYTPFVGKPAKMAYMWRDIERRAEGSSLSPKLPAPYPLEHFDLANRVATVAAAENWCPELVVASYRYWFEQGIPAGSEDHLRRALSDCNQDYAAVIGRAVSPETEALYLQATTDAKQLGIFGSPSFVVGDGELFWGDDRLEDAIRYLQDAA